MKIIQNNLFSNYLKKSVINLIKSKFLFCFFTLFGFLELFVQIIDYIILFFHFNETYYSIQDDISKFLFKFSLLSHLFYFNFGPGFNLNYKIITIYLSLLIIFYLYLFFGKKETNEEDKSKNLMTTIIDKIFINFYDYIFFRIFTTYAMDSFYRGIFTISEKNDYSIYDLIIQLFLFISLLLIVITNYYYFTYVCIWSNFKMIDSDFCQYPYDNFYSQKYDLTVFSMKILLTTIQNYFIMMYDSKYLINITFMFINFVMISIAIWFFCYTFYLFFISQKEIYFYNNFYNKVRLFFVLLLFEIIVIRVGLHSNADYIPFVIILLILFIFNIYVVVIRIDSYLLSSAIKNKNYLGVCWFIQGNDINIQDFTIEWISNHREKCYFKIEYCPICSKLKNDFDIYSEECISLLEENNNQKLNKLKKENLNNKTEKSKINKRISHVTKKTLISEMFPPFEFISSLIKLAERSKQSMDKDELIRLDIVRISVIFYNEGNFEYHFFNTICFLIIKYRNNSQIWTIFMMLFDLMRKSIMISNQKYNILKKNYELNKSLDLYLNKFENFILYEDKSPANYYDISQNYKKFKDLLKDINIFFKKNTECNYELILMRYIYEILVHKKFKNIQPFDLNNYTDFIEYNLTKNKSFYMMNTINQDSFIIVKGCKEILKYQNHQFSNLIPDEFREQGIQKFKNQLNNVKSKTVFEYVIKSFINGNKVYGFIDLFKMKYIIYPTLLMNEIFIEVNYLSGFNNIIIFKKNINGIYFLYSFCAKLYKVFGICPSELHLLAKAGVFIYFDDLFIKGKKTRNNKENKNEEQIYTFKYENYYKLLTNLLSFDIIKDSENYLQIIKKQNEFLKYAEVKKEIDFIINKKCENYLETLNSYILFIIKETKKKNNDLTITKSYLSRNHKDPYNFEEENNQENNSEEDDFELEEEKYERKGIAMAGSILSQASASKSSESHDNDKKKGKKDNKIDEKMEKRKQLRRYTYVLLACTIILIIITIIFLVLENLKSNKLNNVSNLFFIFLRFKKAIERVPLTILTNYQFYYIDGQSIQSINPFIYYSSILAAKSKALNKTTIKDLLKIEVAFELNDMLDYFANYQKGIHNLGATLEQQIQALKGKFYKLYVEEGMLYLYLYDENLFTLSRSYINIITGLLNDNDYLQQSLPLMTFIDLGNNIIKINVSLSNISISMISTTKRNMFLLLLCYPHVHDGLLKTSKFILNEERQILNVIRTIFIFFFIILIIFHVIVFGILILFICSFTNLLAKSISDINKLFENKNYLELQVKRLEQIKIMKTLYNENPFKICNKIGFIEEFYRRKENENMKPVNAKILNLSSTFTQDSNLINEDNNKNPEKNKILDKRKNEDMNNTNTDADLFLTEHDNNNDLNEKNKKSKYYDNNKELSEINSIQFGNRIPKNLKFTYKHFELILSSQYILIYITFGAYFIYSIIFYILLHFRIIEIKHLIDYSDYNDLIDGYLYDDTNALLYLFVTNVTSILYGKIIDSNRNDDYIMSSIDLIYDAIAKKDDIEYNGDNTFKPVVDLVNLNCSNNVIEDAYFIKVAEYFEIDYDEYFTELCKFFPVASSGSDTAMFYEIMYTISQLRKQYSQSDSFEYLFKINLNKTKLYELYTIMLTFNRIQRTYFNVAIITRKEEEILKYFLILMYFYLISNIGFEIIIFIVIYFGEIYMINKKESLITGFLSSLKF